MQRRTFLERTGIAATGGLALASGTAAADITYIDMDVTADSGSPTVSISMNVPEGGTRNEMAYLTSGETQTFSIPKRTCIHTILVNGGDATVTVDRAVGDPAMDYEGGLAMTMPDDALDVGTYDLEFNNFEMCSKAENTESDDSVGYGTVSGQLDADNNKTPYTDTVTDHYDVQGGIEKAVLSPPDNYRINLTYQAAEIYPDSS